MNNPSSGIAKITFVTRKPVTSHCFSCKFYVLWVVPFLRNRGDVNAHFDLLYKLFLYRTGQETRAPGIPRISGQSECEGGKVSALDTGHL